MRAYDEDLAYIHDAGHGDFARRAAPGVLALLRARGIHAGLVVDLGCGSGIWAAELLRAGYDVLGIDISAAMLALAKQRAPHATFRQASLLEAALPACAAVTSLGECVNYLFDDTNSLRKLAGLFRRVHAALAPGGLFVFDVLQPGHVRPNPQSRCSQGDDWAVLVDIAEDAQTQTLTRSITSFRQVGALFRRDREVHRQRLYRGADIAAELRQTGFRVQRLSGYGDMKFKGTQTAFAARKARFL